MTSLKWKKLIIEDPASSNNEYIAEALKANKVGDSYKIYGRCQ